MPSRAEPQRRSAGGVVVLAARRFWEQNMLHHAAALTYYSLMALGQAMLLVVGLLGVLGTREAVSDLSRLLDRAGVDPAVVDGVVGAAEDAIARRGASAVALVLA